MALPIEWYRDDKLEWRTDSQPYSHTARRFVRNDGSILWVATQCGVYASDDALLTKHRDMMREHGDCAVTVRFQIASVDIEQRMRRARLSLQR
jgi:hypothetical protein